MFYLRGEELLLLLHCLSYCDTLFCFHTHTLAHSLAHTHTSSHMRSPSLSVLIPSPSLSAALSLMIPPFFHQLFSLIDPSLSSGFPSQHLTLSLELIFGSEKAAAS